MYQSVQSTVGELAARLGRALSPGLEIQDRGDLGTICEAVYSGRVRNVSMGEKPKIELRYIKHPVPGIRTEVQGVGTPGDTTPFYRGIIEFFVRQTGGEAAWRMRIDGNRVSGPGIDGVYRESKEYAQLRQLAVRAALEQWHHLYYAEESVPGRPGLEEVIVVEKGLSGEHDVRMTIFEPSSAYLLKGLLDAVGLPVTRDMQVTFEEKRKRRIPEVLVVSAGVVILGAANFWSAAKVRLGIADEEDVQDDW
ncbi:hypothetical protein HYS48_04280 [Candidatus Woesearchaeota archaeon]|nr:hypothetical protein [Candidatus Woesearchaeota archaeon]